MLYLILLIILAWILVIIKEFNREKVQYLQYRRKQYFFSYTEYEFFKNLEKVLFTNFGHKYGIFPKVRLADIFETDTQRGINKIRAKHIDFLIVDRERACDPVLAIELNGASHFSQKQKKSDSFKKELFEITGLTLITFCNTQAQNQSYLEQEISKYLGNISKSGISQGSEAQN